MDGFFAVYVTGRSGVSLVLLASKGGRLVGADIGGLKYDGEIASKPDGTGYTCRVTFKVPQGGALIAGGGPAAAATDITLIAELPANFSEGPIVPIQTPTGPLNARFVKLRDFDI
jgi:hypothetical protein